MASDLPRPLAPARGPIPRDRVDRVLAGMGAEGIASRALVARGLAPPELPTGLTLALLQAQPRRPLRDGSPRPTAVSGGVWVREQLTVHAPLPLDVPLEQSGESLRRFVRKGRSYAVSSSETRGPAGELLATNRTTGLERYRADPDAPDAEEGVPEAELPTPGPDPDAARANPCLERLRALREGEVFEGKAVDMSLARLRERDGPVPSNPIHSDPEAARRAGLDVPIAGGAHVLAFAQEVLLQALGDEALYHGAHLDVRWVAPVRAGTQIVPVARVDRAGPDEIAIALAVRCDGARALEGLVRIPLGRG